MYLVSNSTPSSTTNAASELLTKMDRVTVYNHNFTLSKNFTNLTFSCLLNCKKLNQYQQIVGKVQGDLMNKTIQISCCVLENGALLLGTWQYQKIQLMKFANRYNQRVGVGKGFHDGSLYRMKVNPVSGEFYICHNFQIPDQLVKDLQKLQEKVTSQSENLTGQTQALVPQICQLILNRQAHQHPSSDDINKGTTNLSKVLEKLKKLSIISSAYKIKLDISVVNKFRSVFKKVFLRRYQHLKYNKEVVEFGMLAVSGVQGVEFVGDGGIVIRPFQDLDDNQEITLAAMYLQDFSKPHSGEAIIDITTQFSPEEKQQLTQPGTHNIRGTCILVQPLPKKQSKLFEYQLVHRLPYKHRNLPQYYHIKSEQFCSLRLTSAPHPSTLPLLTYLQLHAATMSLTSKLDLMIQVCSVVEVLHKVHVGCFLDVRDVFVESGGQGQGEPKILVRGLGAAMFAVGCWDQAREKERSFNKKYLMDNYKDFLMVCGYEQPKQPTSTKMQQQLSKPTQKFQNQRCDIYSLGLILYRILLNKLPFSENSANLLIHHHHQHNKKQISNFLHSIWTMQTQYYMMNGGLVVKVLAHLLLKCFYLEVEKRPYVQWLKVILADLRAGLDSLY